MDTLRSPQASAPEPPSTKVERRGEDGRLLETVTLDANGALDGPFVAYDDDGQPRMRMNCRGGRPDGPATVYRNGRPEVQMTFVQGRLANEMRRFDGAGRLVSIVRYAAGRRHGLMECRSPEGGPLLSAEYRDDHLNGVWTEFRPDGSIRRRALYRDDLLDGETVEFDPDGRAVQRVVYAAGTVVATPQPPPDPAPPKPKPLWRRLFGP